MTAMPVESSSTWACRIQHTARPFYYYSANTAICNVMLQHFCMHGTAKQERVPTTLQVALKPVTLSSPHLDHKSIIPRRLS